MGRGKGEGGKGEEDLRSLRVEGGPEVRGGSEGGWREEAGSGYACGRERGGGRGAVGEVRER